jgi:glycosyltransferase involved in cell wall biosynthesis
MRICFFGQKEFFDYFKIGGFESFIRRLAIGLTNAGNKVDYILYDSPLTNSIEVLPNFTINYFQGFAEAAHSLLVGAYDHVLRVWLSRRDRLKYLFLPDAAAGTTRWHHVFLAWPSAKWKRALAISEGWLSSRNGHMVCVSPRQHTALGKFFKSACHVFPPVPEGFFVSPEHKTLDHKIRVTFLGNLTRDKYIEEIIGVFMKLKNFPDFHFTIYGTHNHLNPHAVKVHNGLKAQNDIAYVNVDMKCYSSKVDDLVKNVLEDTDVFIQPYRTLDNTLDMPLLLLEAMASLCAVVTTPLGSVAEVYGDSKFIIPRPEFAGAMETLLKNLTPDQLILERKRIHARNIMLNFNMDSVIQQFIHLLNN